MSLIHITSHSIRQLLSLTEKKDELLQGIEEVHAEIIRTLKGGVVGVVEIITSQPAIARPAPAAKPVAVAPSKTVKPAKAKRTMSPEARARIGAATKARWAARRAGKSKAKVAPKTGKPAKVKKKSGLTPAGRAKLAANMKARWAARKAGKPAAKVGKPAKKGIKLKKVSKNPF